jgi:hypothetical protein
MVLSALDLSQLFDNSNVGVYIMVLAVCRPRWLRCCGTGLTIGVWLMPVVEVLDRTGIDRVHRVDDPPGQSRRSRRSHARSARSILLNIRQGRGGPVLEVPGWSYGRHVEGWADEHMQVTVRVFTVART